MENKRRLFLQQLAAGAAWASLGFRGAFGQNEPPAAPANLFRNTLVPTSEEDWAKIRTYFQFPENQVYMNNGTIGLMSTPVIEKLAEKLNVLRQGLYRLEPSAREKIAEMLHASPSEIALTYNTTQGNNIIAQGLKLRKGDEVILCDQEHVGNGLPWLNRVRRTGIKLKILKLANTAAENLDRIDRLVTKRTRAIALPHITCTTGLVLPAKEIATYARSKGIWSFFDGAHGAGMLFPNMKEIGCDFYSSCGHKWLCGPAGTGFLYVRSESLEAVDPIMVGANSDQGWDLSVDTQKLEGFVDTAHRFEYGTQNNAIYQGLLAAIELLESIGYARVRDRALDLAAYLQQKLMETGKVKMLSATEAQSRSGMIGFQLAGMDLDRFRQSQLARDFRIRWVPESGLDSIRISTHIYNNYEEIDRFVEHIAAWQRLK